MIYLVKSTVLLDANVLYPAPVRDYLLYLAGEELYHPKWTNKIQEEWISSLLVNRADLQRKDLERAHNAMNHAFPDANVINYEKYLSNLSLPDVNDNHVLAAAIKAGADTIVTFNLKDFPVGYVKTFGIGVKHPDEFVTNLIGLNTTLAVKAFRNQIKNLKRPSLSKDEVLAILGKCGLKNTVSQLQNQL